MFALVIVGLDHAAVRLADGANCAAEGDAAEDFLIADGLAGGGLIAGEAGGGLDELFGLGAETLKILLEFRGVGDGLRLLRECRFWGQDDEGEKDHESSRHRGELHDSQKRTADGMVDPVWDKDAKCDDLVTKA